MVDVSLLVVEGFSFNIEDSARFFPASPPSELHLSLALSSEDDDFKILQDEDLVYDDDFPSIASAMSKNDLPKSAIAVLLYTDYELNKQE